MNLLLWKDHWHLFSEILKALTADTKDNPIVTVMEIIYWPLLTKKELKQKTNDLIIGFSVTAWCGK